MITDFGLQKPLTPTEENTMALATTEQEWRSRFEKRMNEALQDPTFAKQAADAAEVDLSSDPEEHADAELSYMAEG